MYDQTNPKLETIFKILHCVGVKYNTIPFPGPNFWKIHVALGLLSQFYYCWELFVAKWTENFGPSQV